MTDDVVIVCPEITPGVGGLADYTLRVVEGWGDQTKVRLVVPEPGRAIPFDSLGEKVLLQYSAYGYDAHGYPRRFLRSLIDWRRNHRSRLVVMFHEIWTFWPVLNKNYLVQRLHRAQLRKLIAVADAVFTSTPSQAEHLLQLCPSRAIDVLPVGSNIRPLAPSRTREDGLAILFGLQNNRLRTLRKMAMDLRALAAAKAIRKIISAGQSSEADADERALFSALSLADGFEMRGALPEAEISELLSRASFGISAQDELSVLKSGTFMACAAHGLNILSPAADAMGPEPICWLTQPRELLAGIATEELTSRAQKLRDWQERSAAWPEISRRFGAALQLRIL